MKEFFKFVGPYKKYAVLSPIFVACEVIIEVLMPFIMAKIIDDGILAQAGILYIIKIGILMIFMASCSLFFGFVAGKYAAKGAMGFAKEIRKAIFDKIQDFSFTNIDNFSTASLITRITTDVVNVQNAFMMTIRGAVRSPFMLIGATTMAIITKPKLSLLFAGSIPIVAVSLFIIFKISYSRFQILLKKYDDMNLVVQENLIGIRVVKAFVREEYENQKFKEKARDLKNSQVFAEKIVVFTMPLMNLITYSLILAVLWFGGNDVIKNNMEIGELTSFLTYIMQILMSLLMFSMLLITINFSKASRNRILEVLNTSPTIQDKGKHIEFNNNSIEYKNVCFSYLNSNDKLVLTDINLKINSGEFVGIIGSIGSGKSSLIQLLPRLYDVSQGEILIGENNIKDYTLEVLRSNIGLVLQKNTLFSGTIKENLLWGNENANDDEIIQSCKYAQAHDFIISFKDGYNTILGQSGVNLSGGQKQRLCIARALLKKPKILILDDSTSAVDTTTEAKIQKAIKEYMPNTTKIIIAQRILSVKDADKIIVIDNGMINGIGNHQQLLATNQIYKEIYYSQQDGMNNI